MVFQRKIFEGSRELTNGWLSVHCGLYQRSGSSRSQHQSERQSLEDGVDPSRLHTVWYRCQLECMLWSAFGNTSQRATMHGGMNVITLAISLAHQDMYGGRQYVCRKRVLGYGSRRTYIPSSYCKLCDRFLCSLFKTPLTKLFMCFITLLL